MWTGRMPYTAGIASQTLSQRPLHGSPESCYERHPFLSTAEAIIRLILIGGMIFLLVGGMIAILMVWYFRGRDPQTGLVADILSEPPDDLPPGAAGTLLDEHADHHDVVATLVGLGRNGAVSITQDAGQGARKGDWIITVLHPDQITNRIERDLLNLLFDGKPEPLREVRLRDVRPKFVAAEERIRDDLYRELVEHGYFAGSPVATRNRWRRIAWAGLVLSIVVGLLVAIVVDPVAIATTIAAVIMWAVMVRMSRHMPRKTAKGAEAAAKWRAFKRYLQDIEKHRNLGASAAIFDRYLAYAIAFEIDKGWIRKFSEAGASRPAWLGTGGDVADTLGDVIIIGGDVPDFSGAGDLIGNIGGLAGNLSVPDVNMPDVDLQGLSDTVGGSLQGASDGLSSLLDAAGSIFDAIDFD